MLRTLVAVAVGGAAGTALRLWIDLSLPQQVAGPPISTLLINTIGTLALGIAVGGWWSTDRPEWLKAGLGAGFLGSFTTFSAVAVAAVTLTEAGALSIALSFVALSIVVGLIAASAGLWIGGRLHPRESSTDWSQE